MRAAEAWLVYVFAILLVFILLTLANSNGKFSLPMRLFLAFLVGAIVVLIVAPGITTTGSDDRTWYSLLIVVAFITPLLMAGWLVYNGKLNLAGMGCNTEREVSCNNGECQVVSETQKCGNQVTTTVYQNGSPRAGSVMATRPSPVARPTPISRATPVSRGPPV